MICKQALVRRTEGTKEGETPWKFRGVPAAYQRVVEVHFSMGRE